MISLRLLNDGHPTDISPTYLVITRWQFRLLSLLPPIVASFSVFGTVAILYRILKIDRHEYDANTRRTYHRLLVAMAMFDLGGCVGFIFGTAPVPKETRLEFARGNTATCTAQGFLVHIFLLCVLFYDAGIMIYFLLTIRYSWTEQQVTKRVEPLFHVTAVLFPLAVGVAAISFEAINPVGFGQFCGIGPYPLFCYLDDTCKRGPAGAAIYFYFFVIPAFILVIILYGSITLIYCKVRSQGRRALAITSNRDQVQARTRAVAVQSWLFGALFFCTWFPTPLIAIFFVAVKNLQLLLNSQYALQVFEAIFLPLHGFFIFCIYIRPRFIRFRKDENRSFWSAAKIATFGGPETILTRRRSSMMQRRKGSSTTGYHPSSSVAIRQHMPLPGRDVGSGQPDLTEFDDELRRTDLFPNVVSERHAIEQEMYPPNCSGENVDMPCISRSRENIQDDLTTMAFSGTELYHQSRLPDVEDNLELIGTEFNHEMPNAGPGGHSLVPDVALESSLSIFEQQMQQQRPPWMDQCDKDLPCCSSEQRENFDQECNSPDSADSNF